MSLQNNRIFYSSIFLKKILGENHDCKIFKILQFQIFIIIYNCLCFLEKASNFDHFKRQRGKLMNTY